MSLNFSLSKKINLDEYVSMFNDMIVDSTKQSQIDAAVTAIKAGEERYKSIIEQSKNAKIPFYAIGIAHYMECNCNFTKHIHNGDPLTKRTVLVPAGRPSKEPQAGKGKPYTFEESCLDWLFLKKWQLWQDWRPQDILARLELNNGLGYRNLGIPTPYLWSYTQYYGQEPFIGKFVSDGKFQKYDSKNKPIVSKQVGAAVLLKSFV